MTEEEQGNAEVVLENQELPYIRLSSSLVTSAGEKVPPKSGRSSRRPKEPKGEPRTRASGMMDSSFEA